MRKQYAVHSAPMLRPAPGLGGCEKYVDRRTVRVMAEAEGYAMVRRKGAMPYVAPLKELVFVASQADANRLAEDA